ncbi:MAG: response regulator [Pseudomonadota bacterium]
MGEASSVIGSMVMIDDDETDQYLYRRIIERSGLVATLNFFSLAEDALAHLRRNDRPRVDLITLDINMPRMDGFEFLDQAQAEFGPRFERSVVVLLTTSLNPADRSRALAFPMGRDILNKPLTSQNVATLADVCREATDLSEQSA